MNRMLELQSKMERLRNNAKEFESSHRQANGLLSSKDVETYLNMMEGVYALEKEIDWLRKQAGIDRETDRPEEQKPVLGIKPYYVAAWQRIGELTEAIERQCWSGCGDTKLVQKWAAEIGWQCSMIESLKDGET